VELPKYEELAKLTPDERETWFKTLGTWVKQPVEWAYAKGVEAYEEMKANWPSYVAAAFVEGWRGVMRKMKRRLFGDVYGYEFPDEIIPMDQAPDIVQPEAGEWRLEGYDWL